MSKKNDIFNEWVLLDLLKNLLKMKNILKVSVFVLSIFLASCSDDDGGSTNISDANLSGMVRGEVFEALGGKSFDTSFNGEELISINITNVVADCDSSIFDYDLYLSTDVPFEVGTYEDNNVVFLKEGETSLNFLQSTVIVEEITETTVTVKIASDSSSEDSVEGTFTVNYCE